MYGLAIFDSGNYAYNLARVLEEKNIKCEIVPIPCQIAKNGCGQCIKFELSDMDKIILESKNSKIGIREVYKIGIKNGKNEYTKIR
ncbi:MAG: DUF3343 domain-containing protein [Clostridiales bacterium]|nr:DUF3343 domain-containing protein [Clostridiales bacterium]